jgi:hypothetical protein
MAARAELCCDPALSLVQCKGVAIFSPSSRIRRPKAVFLATGGRYQFDIPHRYFAATAENRCSEDLPYSHALIRVPTIVQREFELAQRHGSQPESSSARVQDTSVVKTISVNSLIDNELALEKPSNPRRRTSYQ